MKVSRALKQINIHRIWTGFKPFWKKHVWYLIKHFSTHMKIKIIKSIGTSFVSLGLQVFSFYLPIIDESDNICPKYQMIRLFLIRVKKAQYGWETSLSSCSFLFKIKMDENTQIKIKMREMTKDEEHLKDVIEMKNKRIELLDSTIEMLLQEKYER